MWCCRRREVDPGYLLRASLVPGLVVAAYLEMVACLREVEIPRDRTVSRCLRTKQVAVHEDAAGLDPCSCIAYLCGTYRNGLDVILLQCCDRGRGCDIIGGEREVEGFLLPLAVLAGDVERIVAVDREREDYGGHADVLSVPGDWGIRSAGRTDQCRRAVHRIGRGVVELDLVGRCVHVGEVVVLDVDSFRVDDDPGGERVRVAGLVRTGDTDRVVPSRWRGHLESRGRTAQASCVTCFAEPAVTGCDPLLPPREIKAAEVSRGDLYLGQVTDRYRYRKRQVRRSGLRCYRELTEVRVDGSEDLEAHEEPARAARAIDLIAHDLAGAAVHGTVAKLAEVAEIGLVVRYQVHPGIGEDRVRLEGAVAAVP